MRIREDVKKCVVFVDYQMVDMTFRFAGSAFYIGREQENGLANPTFAVTARHVIEGIRSKGLDKVFLRVNLKNGRSEWFYSSINDWFVHPDDPSIDVAVLYTGLLEEFDHLALSYSLCVTDQIMLENEIGLGDEVFITGLFRHHYGNTRNIPIVRVGNLACLAEDRISTKSYGDINAYLIEARSIGGLSGSPVFLNLGIVRLIENQVKFTSGEVVLYLLGLMHGHYDVETSNIDVHDDALSTERVNTGIGIVVPFHSINEVITEYERVHSI